MLKDYAKAWFNPDRSLVEALLDLNFRIHEEFKYEPASTDVTTPLAQVMRERRGVCQDFAHVAVGCLRSLGLAARYASGYIETLPPEGKQRLVGADASHAWFSALIPGWGWFDLDPTNSVPAGSQHITVAYGRDFSDVSPLKGVVEGGGRHILSVSVDVKAVLAHE
jgi:transglutaminase-like putative cysteine protease